MEAVRIYLLAENVAPMLAAKIGELIENASMFKDKGAFKYDIVNGFPVQVVGQPEETENIVSLTDRRTRKGEGAITIGEFRKAKNRAEEAGYHIFFEYTLVSPGLLCSPQALYMAGKTNADPLMNTMPWGKMCVEDLSVLLVPVEASRAANIQVGLTEVMLIPMEGANQNVPN